MYTSTKATHQYKFGNAGRFGPIVEAVAAYSNQFGLPVDRKSMPAVDYRFALSNLTLVNTFSKKSFFRVSCPIVASWSSRAPGDSTRSSCQMYQHDH